MIYFLPIAAIVMTICLGLGLVRVFIGPSVEDRMMSAQLLGTTGVGLLLLIGTMLEMPSSIDVTLVLALLATFSVTALTRRIKPEEPSCD